MKNERNTELGEIVASMMQDILDVESNGFEVTSADIDMELSEKAGPLQGKWRITVEKIND